MPAAAANSQADCAALVDQQGDVPPWLEGADEPKSYKIGGTELSEEYLQAGDELPETVELGNDLRYVDGGAGRIQARQGHRRRSPCDLIDAIQSDATGEPELAVTGQLPDWFLGLEELDTTDAPDWFAGEPPPPPDSGSGEIPPWMSDMVGETPAAPKEELPDDIGSFFSSLGGLSEGR